MSVEDVTVLDLSVKASKVSEETALLLAAQKIRLISEAFREGVGCEEIGRLPVACHQCSLCQWKPPKCQ